MQLFLVNDIIIVLLEEVAGGSMDIRLQRIGSVVAHAESEVGILSDPVCTGHLNSKALKH